MGDFTRKNLRTAMKEAGGVPVPVFVPNRLGQWPDQSWVDEAYRGVASAMQTMLTPFARRFQC